MEELARAGRIIPAITLHREICGSSLADAKDAVEDIMHGKEGGPTS